MKILATTLIVTIIALGATSLNAQTQKGTFLIGDLYRPGSGSNYFATSSPMNLGFGTETTKSDGYDGGTPAKNIHFNIMPRAGYFIADKLLLGLDLTLAYKREKTENRKYTSDWLSAGPFIRYYVPLERFLPFIEMNASLGRSKFIYTSDSFEDTDTYKKSSLGGGAGVAIMLGKKASFDVMAAYNRTLGKRLEDNEENIRNISHSVGVKLGFSIWLGQDPE